ncbi:MAG: DUF4340 domain-containing protein [Candidatus Binatia bacterium]
MNLRNTLFSALLFLVLAAYLYFFELNKDPEGKGEKLLRFKEEEVESLILSYPDQEIRMQKESSGKWKIMQPLETAANGSTIRTVLSVLSSADINKTIEKEPSGDDIKAFGLDKPKVRVSITLQKGKTLPSLLIGDKTPVGGSMYAKRDDNPTVYTIEEFSYRQLNKRLADFLGEEPKK